MKNRLTKTAMALLAAMLATAFAASAASATTVSPAGHRFTATASGPTTFEADNGTSGLVLSCDVSTADGQVPTVANPANAYNALANGSVVGGLDAPIYDDCEVVGFPTVDVDVDTSLNPDEWSVTAMHAPGHDDDEGNWAHINIPNGAVEIDLTGAINCTFEVPGGAAISVFGYWTNGTNSTNDPSTLDVNGQVTFAGNCPGTSAAQYLGSYDVVNTTTGTNQPITITN